MNKTGYIVPNDVISEYWSRKGVEKVWKGSWYVEVISQNRPGRTENNRENMSEYLVSRPRIEPVTFTANMRRLAVSNNMLDST